MNIKRIMQIQMHLNNYKTTSQDNQGFNSNTSNNEKDDKSENIVKINGDIGNSTIVTGQGNKVVPLM